MLINNLNDCNFNYILKIIDVCYICTEDAFPIQRLDQILKNRYKFNETDKNIVFDRVLIFHATDLVYFIFSNFKNII